MRIALVNNLYVDQLGYFYISSALKAAGHDVRFFLTSRRLEQELKSFDPQLVGLTAVTGSHLWAAETALEIRTFLPGTRTILGGPHPTYHPSVIEHPGLDFVCRGEGEIPVVELCRKLEDGEPAFDIPGVTAKEGDQVHENGFPAMVEDLDTIAFPDRSIYQQFFTLASRNHYPFMLSSRGCPFHCAFCYAPTLADLTRDKGRFVRFRSVDNVIEEALELKAQFNLKTVEFVDDIFGMKRPWLEEFSQRWPVEVSVPFQCNLRADLVNDQTVELLVKGGCGLVAFGVESGTERVRNEILHKDVSTDQIVAAAKLLKAAGLRVVTYNIVGAPTETWEETLETLRLNQRIKPDYSQVSIMQPYPGTRIHDFAVEHCHLGQSEREFDQIEPFNYGTSPLKLDHAREVANLQKLFYIAVRFPRLTPMVLRLAKWPENRLFYVLFLLIHVTRFHWQIKKVPSLFIIRLVLSVKEIWRRRARRDPPKEAEEPSLKDRIESGAEM